MTLPEESLVESVFSHLQIFFFLSFPCGRRGKPLSPPKLLRGESTPLVSTPGCLPGGPPPGRRELAWLQVRCQTSMGGAGVYDAYELRGACYAACFVKVSGTSLAGGGALLNSRPYPPLEGVVVRKGGVQHPPPEGSSSGGGVQHPPPRR